MSRVSQFFGFMFIFFLISCKSDPLPDDNSLHIRLKKDPERINPLLFPNPTAREIYQYIHLPLADFDPVTLSLTPVLITEIPAEIAIDTGIYKGGVAFDFKIVDDAKWDNGSPITSEDYLFTIKAINMPLTNAGKYRELTQNIANIVLDQTNNKKIRVIFKHDYMLALETAVNIEIYPRYFYDSLNILSKYSFKDLMADNEEKLKNDTLLTKFAEKFNSNDFSRNQFCGAGPYKFVSWSANQNIIIEKKENYWAKDKKQAILQQGPDKMIFHIIPDELTALTQLKANKLDVINEISAGSYNAMEDDSLLKNKFAFYHPALMKQYFIVLNNQDPILQDVNVRKALAHLIDVKSIIQNLEGGMGVISVGAIHPLKKTFNTTLKPIPYDLEKAKQLLSEAGWKDSNNNGTMDKKLNGKNTEMEIEILISGQELGKNLSILLQENAAKVGIKIKITEKDFKLIRAENLKPRKFQMVPSVFSQDIVTWDDMSKWSSENDTPDGSNDASYRNSITDDMIKKIVTLKDDKDRMEMYQKIQAQIYEDQPVIFLYAPEEKIIVSKKWTSFATIKRPGYMANTFRLAGSKASTK